MALLTVNPSNGVLAVIEEYKVRQLVYPLRWNLALSHIDVAHLTLRDRREAGAIASLGIAVTGYTLQL